MLQKTNLLIVFVLVSIFSAYAQEDTESIKITTAEVKRFVNSFPEIKTDLEAIDVKYVQTDNDITMPEGLEIISKVNKIVQKYGYADYTNFLVEAGAILSAYTAVELGRESGSVQPEIQEAIEEIEKNPHYTAEQKKQMKDMLIQTSKTMEDYSKSASTDENVSVVKPYVDQIRQMLEDNDD